MLSSAERKPGPHKEITMQHAADKFERTQPAELRRVPFSVDELDLVPGAFEAIGWVLLAFFMGCLLFGLLGL